MNKINYSDPRRSVPDTVSTILALVLGIVGLILALLAFLPCLGWVAIVPGLLCAILAIILGAVAVKRSDDRTYGSARGALTCGCVGLVIIIGAIIYQGMILAPVMKQADAHTEEFTWTACSAVREARKEMHPNACEAVDRVISLIDHPEERKETVTERFLEVAPPAPRGATAVLVGPVPSVSGK